MDAPPEKENSKSFVKITKKLLACHINVPIIHNVDLEKGFLLLSDFGDNLYLDAVNNSSIYDLYSDAINALVTMQLSSNVAGLNNYSSSLFKSEMDLFVEWLVEKHLNIKLNEDAPPKVSEKTYQIIKKDFNNPQNIAEDILNGLS